MSRDERPLPGLERIRLQRLMTPDELADRAEVSGQTVRRIERGGTASLRTIRRLADALECAPGELASAVSDAVVVRLPADAGD